MLMKSRSLHSASSISQGNSHVEETACVRPVLRYDSSRSSSVRAKSKLMQGPSDVSKDATCASNPNGSNGLASSLFRDASDTRMQCVCENLENSWAEGDGARGLGDIGTPWAFNVSVDEKPQCSREEITPEFFANVGDAIRALREDIPCLFERELNYDIYREEITFRDPRVSFHGLKNYKTMFWSLRFHGKLFFKELFVEVKRVWQPEDMVIKMRWTVHGVPRMLSDQESLFDGISTYKLDGNGRVYEHAVDNVLLRDTPMFSASPILAGVDRAFGVPKPQQAPYPGAWGCESRASQSTAAHPAPPASASSATPQATPSISSPTAPAPQSEKPSRIPWLQHWSSLHLGLAERDAQGSDSSSFASGAPLPSA